MKNYNPIRVRVLDESEHEGYYYKTLESDSIFMLIKPPRIEKDQALMVSIQFDMLQGEKFVRFFCYMSPWEIFEFLESENSEKLDS